MSRKKSQLGERTDSRETRRHAPAVYQLEETGIEDSPLSGLEGSITVVWAERESKMLNEFQRALTLEDEALVGDVKERMVETVAEELESGGTTASSSETFDVVYDGREVATDIVADTDSFGAALFSYNGGELDETQFRIHERTEETSDTEYEYLVVVAPPSLNEAEKEAHEVTTAESDSFTTPDPIQATTPAAVTAAMAVYCAAQLGGGPKESVVSDSKALDSLSDDDSEVGASVDELIETRNELFG